MNLATAEQHREAYTKLHDHIAAERRDSPYALRRYAHRRQWRLIADLVPPGSNVLDAGCGDGILSVMLAKKGCTVTGIDLSEPNIAAARELAKREGVADRVTFLTGAIEHLPFPDRSFSAVVCSHVLEHLPDFQKGVRELARCAQEHIIIAIPTCLNPCAMALLGGDTFWVLSRKSLLALPRGFLRVLLALLRGEEGVHEGYEGHGELVHISRFPWRGKRSLEEGGCTVRRYAASRLLLFPYCIFLLPFARLLERCAWWPIFRNFGHGTTYVCTPRRMTARP